MVDAVILTDADIVAWHDAKWPEKGDNRVVAAKLAEECGEVCGAVIKQAEGRRTTADVLDEIGDALIVLTVLSERYGYAIAEARARRFAHVRAR